MIYTQKAECVYTQRFPFVPYLNLWKTRESVDTVVKSRDTRASFSYQMFHILEHHLILKKPYVKMTFFYGQTVPYSMLMPSSYYFQG